MNFVDTIYERISNLKKSKFSANDAIKATGLQFGFDKKTLIKTLDVLCKEGKLVKMKNDFYAIVRKTEQIKCQILATTKDYAFARPISHFSDKNNGEDIFVPAPNLNDACHGDIVIIEIEPSNARQRGHKMFADKQEGRVVQILKRGFEVVVGVLNIDDNGIATLKPDDERFASTMYIAKEDLNGAKSNTKVVADVLDYPSPIKMARGRVREILGNPGEARVETLSIIRSFNLFEEFPKEVEDEANKVAVKVSEKELKGRKDFRDKLIITIDGDDARDFDDAISVEKNGENYELGVYIADVSHYVTQNSKIDEEAFKRGTSVYFPDYVLPMLPKVLSNGMCSLNPNEDRLVLAVNMIINKSGKIVDYQINKGVINSKFRMTYANVSKILQGDKEKSKEYKIIVPMIALMGELAKILIARRDNAGNLDFDIPEPEITLNDDGTVKDVKQKPRELSNRIIEQFMVVTNEVVARHFCQMNMPFVYRVHEKPSVERLNKFKAFVSSLGLKFSASGKTPSPKDFQLLLKQSENQDYSTALSKIMLRSMQKARYDSENLGHFGLALEDYCHFTSPIRRYPDLTIHRIISDTITGQMTDKKLKFYEQFVISSSDQSSLTERKAEEAERTVDDQKKTEFMQTKIGEVFDGIISGITPNGFFVELENTVEGFVSVLRLPKARYEFFENNYALSGAGKIYKIGDKISIRVVSTNILERKIDFELADYHNENIISDNLENMTKGNSRKNNFNKSKKRR